MIPYRNRCKSWMSLLKMAVFCILAVGGAAAQKGAKENDRVRDAGYLMKELVTSRPGIPTSLLNKADCVIVIPSTKKAGFMLTGSYGRGLMTCRTGEGFNGPWSAPLMMKTTGGNIGPQVGLQFTDYVVLVMNERGGRALKKGKAKLGAEASVAAGPFGRNAEAATNGSMNAKLLSYSKAQGIFIGLALSGASFGPDHRANENLYGEKATATQIIDQGDVQTPESAKMLLKILTEKSPNNTSSGAPPPPAAAQERVKQSGDVIKELVNSPEGHSNGSVE
jgi:SH3 domain-containing YSC84-like protein 1